MDISDITQFVDKKARFNERKQKWDAWMQKPENRAMLLQTGVSLLQGPVNGQGQFSQFGTAIGQGVAARDRVIQGERDAAKDRQVLAMQNEELASRRQRTALDKEELAIRKSEASQRRLDSEANRDYKSKMGLSSVLRAQKVTGRKPKSLDEAWMERSGELIAQAEALGSPLTDEALDAAKQKFFRTNASAAASPMDAPIDDVPMDIEGQPSGAAEGTIIESEDGLSSYVSKGGKWTRM